MGSKSKVKAVKGPPLPRSDGRPELLPFYESGLISPLEKNLYQPANTFTPASELGWMNRNRGTIPPILINLFWNYHWNYMPGWYFNVLECLKVFVLPNCVYVYKELAKTSSSTRFVLRIKCVSRIRLVFRLCFVFRNRLFLVRESLISTLGHLIVSLIPSSAMFG